MRNLQEQVRKTFCYQKLFLTFTVWIDCSSDFKKFTISSPSVSNFKSFFWITRTYFFTEGQNKENTISDSLSSYKILHIILICEWSLTKIFLMKGMSSPNVIIHGSTKYTPNRKPMKAPSLFGLFSQFKMHLWKKKININAWKKKLLFMKFET